MRSPHRFRRTQAIDVMGSLLRKHLLCYDLRWSGRQLEGHLDHGDRIHLLVLFCIRPVLLVHPVHLPSRNQLAANA